MKPTNAGELLGRNVMVLVKDYILCETVDTEYWEQVLLVRCGTDCLVGWI